MFDDQLRITTRQIVLILVAAWVLVISCSIPNWSFDETVLTPNLPTSIPNEPAPTLNVPTATPFQPILITSEPTSTSTVTASTGSFELIGHTPLLNRGMNAGLAVYGNYAYVGSRTDGSHPDAGVLVVDISNPANPAVVHQIGPPEEGLPGQTSRELRVWPEQELLMVLNFHCEARLHDCGLPTVPPHISFYDISGANAAQPRLIAIHSLGRTPHEFFLWDDPKVPGRALLYVSTPDRLGNNLLAIDISRARQGVVQEVSNWSAPPGQFRATLHSVSLSVDGRRAYLAHLQDGF